MSGFESLLEARSSFVLAAFAVSWLATVLLALVVAHLHVRLAHLERTLAVDDRRQPYGHLIGRRVSDLIDGFVAGPRAVLMLSDNCDACDRLLAEIQQSGDRWPISVAWRRDTAKSLPAGIETLDEGARLADAIGVSVSPFVLVLDAAGCIASASPATRWAKVRDLLGASGGVPAPDAVAAPGTTSTSLDSSLIQGASS